MIPVVRALLSVVLANDAGACSMVLLSDQILEAEPQHQTNGHTGSSRRREYEFRDVATATERYVETLVATEGEGTCLVSRSRVRTYQLIPDFDGTPESLQQDGKRALLDAHFVKRRSDAATCHVSAFPRGYLEFEDTSEFEALDLVDALLRMKKTAAPARPPAEFASAFAAVRYQQWAGSEDLRILAVRSLSSKLFAVEIGGTLESDCRRPELTLILAKQDTRLLYVSEYPADRDRVYQLAKGL